jgi:hypothetical protein
VIQYGVSDVGGVLNLALAAQSEPPAKAIVVGTSRVAPSGRSAWPIDPIDTTAPPWIRQTEIRFAWFWTTLQRAADEQDAVRRRDRSIRQQLDRRSRRRIDGEELARRGVRDEQPAAERFDAVRVEAGNLGPVAAQRLDERGALARQRAAATQWNDEQLGTE